MAEKMKDKNIKVYLQYPWKFPDSTYYKTLISHPPQGIEYITEMKQEGVLKSRKHFNISNFIKSKGRYFLRKLNISFPNAVSTKTDKDYSIIHCAHCLSKNDTPWVADFESLWQLYIGKRTPSSIRKVGKILSSSNCKHIMAWTEHAKKEICEHYPSIRDKVSVVYPAIEMPEKEKDRKKKDRTIDLLFIGRYFYAKGGLHALEAIDRLTKRYKDVRGVIISDVPEEIKSRYSDNRKIQFHSYVSEEKLKEIYTSSDIFIYPGYSDTFGFCFLEAMGYGIPIITVDKEGRKEIVDDGVTGFVIDCDGNISRENIGDTEKEVIDKILEKADQLINDRKLRDWMSKKGQATISEGRFSIEERNNRLSRIYGDALR